MSLYGIKVLPLPRAEAKGKLLGERGVQPKFADKESFPRVLSVTAWICPQIFSIR